MGIHGRAGLGLARDKNVGSVITVKVKFNEAGDVVLAEFGVGLQIEPRVLSCAAVFREMTLHRVAEGNGPEVRACNVAGVGAAEDIFKVHKTAGSKVGRANAERKRRLFFSGFLEWPRRHIDLA